MHEKQQSFHSIREGAFAGLPIVIGYLPIAMTFGILAKTIGISMLDTFLFSAVVFAGSSQFMALNLIGMGSGPGEVIITTLLVNFRHFLMSASLATRLEKNMKKWFPLIAFGVTDEAFSIISFRDGETKKEFILALEAVGYVSWVGGTLIGYFAGSILPEIIQESMGIAIYAMFVSLLMPEVRRATKVGILACLSGAINALLNHIGFLPQGWNLIFSIIAASLFGTYLFTEKEVGT